MYILWLDGIKLSLKSDYKKIYKVFKEKKKHWTDINIISHHCHRCDFILILSMISKCTIKYETHKDNRRGEKKYIHFKLVDWIIDDNNRLNKYDIIK